MAVSERVAILCPGPSLVEVWSEEQAAGYSCIYAVNTAAWRFTHHWLCACDSKIFVPYFERPDPAVKVPLVGVITNRPHREKAVAKRWRAELPMAYYGLGLSEEQKKRCGREKCGLTFAWTVNEALRRHSCPVDVYGMDYAIGAKCIGGVDGDRSRRRFHDEALWLREWWDESRLTVYGDAPQELIEFLSGRRKDW